MQQPKQFTNSSRAIDDASRLQFIVWCDSRQTCSTVINHTTIWRLNIVFGDTQFDFQCLCLRKTESEWKKIEFQVSIIFFAIVPLSVVEMQKHAWFLVEPEVKQFNHRKNFLISKTLANLVIQFRNQFCAGASHKMLNWIWNTTRLIFSKMPMTSSCNQCIESWWEHFSPPTRKSAVVFNVEMIVVISRSEHDTFLRLISVKMYAKLSCQARHLNEIQLIKILLKPTR